MQHKYYMLVSMNNSLKARATVLTPEECTAQGFYDGYHEDGNTIKDTPDRYLDGYDDEGEFLDALRDLREGNY